MNKINTNLHAYNKHFVFVKDLFFSKNLPNSILFSGEKGIGKKTFLLHFLNFIQLNSQQQKNYLNSYTLESSEVISKIANNELSNIRIVKKLDKSQNISIDQIRDNIRNKCPIQANIPIEAIIDHCEILGFTHINGIKMDIITKPTTPVNSKVSKGLSDVLNLRVIIR